MALAEGWVHRLYDKFCEIYGGAFSIDDSTYKSIWLTTFENGCKNLSNAEIKRGLYLCGIYNREPIPNVIRFWHYAKAIPYKVKEKTWNK